MEFLEKQLIYVLKHEIAVNYPCEIAEIILITAVEIFNRRFAQFCPDRIEVDVADRVDDVCLVVDRPAEVAALEYCPRAAVMAVVPVREAQFEALHDAADLVDFFEAQYQMYVIAHKTEGKNFKFILFVEFYEDVGERAHVFAVGEDRLAVVPFQDNVLDARFAELSATPGFSR